MIFKAKIISEAGTLRQIVDEWDEGGERMPEGYLVVIHLSDTDVGKLVVERFTRDAANSIYAIFGRAAGVVPDEPKTAQTKRKGWSKA